MLMARNISAILKIVSFKDKGCTIMIKHSYIKGFSKTTFIMAMANIIGRMDLTIKELINKGINMEMESMSKEIH